MLYLDIQGSRYVKTLFLQQSYIIHTIKNTGWAKKQTVLGS